MQLRAGIFPQLLFGLPDAGVVVLRVFLYGLDLKQLPAGEGSDHLGHNLGVALTEILNAAVDVIFSLAGIINDKGFAHGRDLLLLSDLIVTLLRNRSNSSFEWNQ